MRVFDPCPKVEGRSGVVKLAACLSALPPTAFRVVFVSSSEGVEGELGPVLESGLWTDVPERTLVFVAAAGEEVCRVALSEPPIVLLGRMLAVGQVDTPSRRRQCEEADNFFDVGHCKCLLPVSYLSGAARVPFVGVRAATLTAK